MDDREVRGVFGALFVAAGIAVVVFAGVVAFSPERTASRAPTPVPLTAEVESLGQADATPDPDKDGEGDGEKGGSEKSTNRNERARSMFKWDR